ncbi:hypothetical protein QJS10_CPB20g00957 [Acorus calamus]|uniref:KIB1-4 beta-propeller domain-containing protein n=1 Tax=Acorus calamus TaxID=4465 RepID=A0AAV9CD43_ACOCL|nr:hypothetical protein QJS10_CPB20g00957 [Acorus calamus]
MTAILIHKTSILYAREEDESWTTLSTGVSDAIDVIHHKGLFYTLDCDGAIECWDPRGPSPSRNLISRTPWGQALLLHRNQRFCRHPSVQLVEPELPDVVSGKAAAGAGSFSLDHASAVLRYYLMKKLVNPKTGTATTDSHLEDLFGNPKKPVKNPLVP